MNEFEILIIDNIENADLHKLNCRTIQQEERLHKTLDEAKSQLKQEKKNRKYAVALIIEHIKPGNVKKVVHHDYEK